MQQNNPLKATSYALMGMLSLSFSSAGVKYSTLSAYTIIVCQCVICLAALVPWILKRGSRALVSENKKELILRGIYGWIGFSALFVSLSKIPLVDATLLRSTAPLFLPLVILIALRKMIPASNWLPLGIGFIGVWLILMPTGGNLSIWHLVALASGLFGALSIYSTRLLAMKEPTQVIAFYFLATSLICSLPFAAHDLFKIPLSELPVLLIIGIGFYLSLIWMTRSYSYAKAVFIAPFVYFSVIFAGIIGWVLWGHIPSTLSMIGIGLVLLGGISSVVIETLPSKTRNNA